MLALTVSLGSADPARAAATIVLQNVDAPGVGFNDPTPAAPIGGNSGTTLGQQRLFAATFAANTWGATLTSNVAIVVQASCSLQPPCDAELGQVSFPTMHANFAGAPFANTAYVPALANKLASTDLNGSLPEFAMTVCTPPGGYYLGLDGAGGAQPDLVSRFQHLIAHGMGFWNATAANGGSFPSGIPTIWDRFLYDDSIGKLWVDMTPSERSASLSSPGSVVWTGANVSSTVPTAYVLAPRVTVAGPEAGAEAGDLPVASASFGTPIGAVSLQAQLMPALRAVDGTGGACGALSALDVLAVQGRVALIERRPECSDVLQAKNVQNAGAIAALLIDDSGAPSPDAPIGFDPSVSIPTAAISSADGAGLVNVLTHRGRHASGVTAALTGDPAHRLGADSLGRALIYTPATFVASAASHFDPSATPNQLMEPVQNPGVSHTLGPPADLTLPLLRDIGW